MFWVTGHPSAWAITPTFPTLPLEPSNHLYRSQNSKWAAKVNYGTMISGTKIVNDFVL